MSEIKLQQIEELKAEAIANLESNDDELQIGACSQLSRFFIGFGGINPPSEGFISGIVPRLLEFLDRDDYPKLQLAATRAIAYISLESSDNIHINILIEQGAVPTVVSLLSSPTDEHHGELEDELNLHYEYYRYSLQVDDTEKRCAQWKTPVLISQSLSELKLLHALVVLGTIASVSAKYRDFVLSHGVLMPLLEQFNDKTNLTIMGQATETLSKLCLRKPQFEQVKSAILPLAHVIHTDDQIVLKHACEALFHLTCGEMDMKQAVIDAGAFPRLFELLLSVKKSLSSVVRRYRKSYILYVRIVDNIISYVDDTQIQAVIEAGIISPLLPLLQDADLFNAAAEVIYNVTTKGTNEQIRFLVHEGCIEPMCDLLVKPNEAHVIKIYLEGLENILKVGEAEKNQGNTEDVNVFAQMIVDARGLEKIKNVQTHDNSKIREQAEKILETYW
ncbi:unnamed protein product [Fraxinus pennsylvanica]|uniref:Importin subunit alpha n=1 Tax=Fraxinus pennsylvanica TaxID=56036 RepID=A0AAD2A001_9LAMI|nr:unnamed protein product [Fraxinus pennsylvanica]